MRIAVRGLLAALLAIGLSACGSGGSSSSPSASSSGAAPVAGQLIQNPPLRIASLTASTFAANLAATASGQQLMAVAGTPACGVDFYYIQYNTVGGAGEATTASGALMVPTGSSSQCSGARPTVLYAHGTTIDRTYNIADITNPNNTEGALVAAMFAAQGYVVVASNYAGYDSSTLPYHPYLNAQQQSGDMINALTAARSAFPLQLTSGTSLSSKLFVTGYSQGGHVAMATERALEVAGIPVTAAAPMSGPYALAALGDAVFYGDVNLGSTLFTPLLAVSYQHAYGNIYSSPSDIFSPEYATGITTLLPSATLSETQIFTQNLLPETALFSSTPPAPTLAGFTPPTPTTQPGITAAQAELFALGFGTNFLVNNSYRLAYLEDALANPDGFIPTASTYMPAANPTNTLRQAFKKNDLRGYVPNSPILLCGGDEDPTVFFFNAQVMNALFTGANLPSAYNNLLDVDSAVTGPNDPYALIKEGFAQAKAAVATAAVAAGATDGGQTAVIEAYHGTLVPPFCSAAARGFFSHF